MTVKKGDTVLVLAGKDRGKQGTVERIEPEVASRIEHGDYRASLGAVARVRPLLAAATV